MYADVGEGRQLIVGNVLYKNGAFVADRASRGSLDACTYAGILPAHFGHTFLIRYNSLTSAFDFDNVKFNN